MDIPTLQVYENQAREFAARHRLIEPEPVYAAIRSCFRPGESSADVGCGSGRDVAWLNANGYPAVGYDASPQMLAEATRVYPQCEFRLGSLPLLADVPDGQFANVLCSAVLMHLGREELAIAARSLARITRPEGRLIVTFRVSRCDDERESDGRLFTALTPEQVGSLLEEAGFQLLLTGRSAEPARPEVVWHRLVAERIAL